MKSDSINNVGFCALLAVAAELEKDGIPSSEIAIFAKGKRDLPVPTGDGVEEPQNRRVQIVYGGGA